MSFEICDDYDFKEKRCLQGEDNCPYRYPDLDEDSKKCKGAYFSRHLDGLDYWDMDDDNEDDNREDDDD